MIKRFIPLAAVAMAGFLFVGCGWLDPYDPFDPGHGGGGNGGGNGGGCDTVITDPIDTTWEDPGDTLLWDDNGGFRR